MHLLAYRLLATLPQRQIILQKQKKISINCSIQICSISHFFFTSIWYRNSFQVLLNYILHFLIRIQFVIYCQLTYIKHHQFTISVSIYNIYLQVTSLQPSSPPLTVGQTFPSNIFFQSHANLFWISNSSCLSWIHWIIYAILVWHLVVCRFVLNFWISGVRCVFGLKRMFMVKSRI